MKFVVIKLNIYLKGSVLNKLSAPVTDRIFKANDNSEYTNFKKLKILIYFQKSYIRNISVLIYLKFIADIKKCIEHKIF